MADLLNIYACGGAGINIIKQLNKQSPAKRVFVDTSVSNMKDVDRNSTFVVDDMDGAGKHRATTYEAFKEYANDILIKFKPSEGLNIVVSSLSGGSGSIIAPMLTRELLKEGKNVIVIGVATKNSVIEINNTIKTLKSYKSTSDLMKRSIALYLIDEDSREQADKAVHIFVNIASMLVDKSITEEFDISDLANFINFEKVTDNDPNIGVVTLDNNVSTIPGKNVNLVSTILITSNKAEKLEPVMPEYLATCINTDGGLNESIRIDNSLGLMAQHVSQLEQILKEHQDHKALSRHQDLDVEGNSDGLVL